LRGGLGMYFDRLVLLGHIAKYAKLWRGMQVHLHTQGAASPLYTLRRAEGLPSPRYEPPPPG
jgi:hypothetical protein